MTDSAPPAPPTPAAGRPLRVLHVLSAMNRGGIETWLMQVLRRQDPARVTFELLLFTPEGGAYDPELRALGITVRRCPSPRRVGAFLGCLWRTLRAGHYDVVHSHVHHFSGVILFVAWLAGVRGRVAHSHLNTEGPDRASGAPRRLYLRAMKAAIARASSEGLAVSDQAAGALFGPRWRTQEQWRVLPLGLDPAPYTRPTDRAALRASLGLAPEALVLGHIGWFRPAKNHPFLLRVFAEVLARRPEARLLLIGEGEQQAEVQALAGELGVLDAVVFAGPRDDVPALLQVMDVFVFPSHIEGLGLALIEAQMAGLSCVTADHLPPEAWLPGASVTALPLAAGAATWAQAILKVAGQPAQFPAPHPYDLTHSLPLLLERYEHYRR